jgi:hypothetical protein
MQTQPHLKINGFDIVLMYKTELTIPNTDMGRLTMGLRSGEVLL